MKYRKIAMILSAAATMFAAAACTDYSEQLGTIQSDIDAISGTSLPAIDRRISAIQTSLDDYAEAASSLQSYTAEYETRLAGLESSLDDAKSMTDQLLADMTRDQADSVANAYASIVAYYGDMIEESKVRCSDPLDSLTRLMGALDLQIDAAKAYADSSYQASATWAEGLFATLDQYDTLSTLVADVRSMLETTPGDIEALSNRIDNMIGADLQARLDTLNSPYAAQIETLRAKYTESMSAFSDNLTNAYRKDLNAHIDTLRQHMASWIGDQFKDYTKAADAYAEISHKRDSLAQVIADEDAYLQVIVERFQPYIGNINQNLTEHFNNLCAMHDNLVVTARQTEEEADALLAAITSARAELKADWEAIIASAVDATTASLQQTITAKLEERLVNYSSEISTLVSQVLVMQGTVADLEAAVSEAEKLAQNSVDRYKNLKTVYDEMKEMVQSATILPQHSDGSVDVHYNYFAETDSLAVEPLTITVEVQRALLASDIVDMWTAGKPVLAVRAIRTLTKASIDDYVTLDIKSVERTSDYLLRITVDPSGLRRGFFMGTESANGVIDFCQTDGTPYLSTTYFGLKPVPAN